MTLQSDTELVRLAAAGDADAFTELVRRHRHAGWPESAIPTCMEVTMSECGDNTTDVLAGLVAQAVAYGANSLEIECKDGHEEVCAMKGSVGFGIASFPSASEEARDLRGRLHSMGRKGKTIRTPAGDFRVTVSSYESFGETAYRVLTQARPRK